jgi:CRISPR-associated protein Cas2
MAEPRHWYLVMYDVSDPKALKRVNKTLKGWGVPLQYSVFAVRASARDLEKLRFQLARFMDKYADRLMIIRLCAGCAARVVTQGRSELDGGLPTVPDECEIV